MKQNILLLLLFFQDKLRALITHGMRDAVILIDDIRCFGSRYKGQELPAHEGYPNIQTVCALYLSNSYVSIKYWQLTLNTAQQKYLHKRYFAK